MKVTSQEGGSQFIVGVKVEWSGGSFGRLPEQSCRKRHAMVWGGGARDPGHRV